MSTKCEVVSESLVRKIPDGSEFYEPFCLGLSDWCPCCIKMVEQQKSKPLWLKRPHVKHSGQESNKKSTKKDKNQICDVSSDSMTNKKARTDVELHGTSSNQ